ncbi:hypothetical protein CCMA1212_005871 [Trichoderma ghanense]|uniref:Uncharacterized protein n=1 Tax=Trichoderma ghanense TaxID=65468 RepID=A0ABY2H5N5_9HYPO
MSPSLAPAPVHQSTASSRNSPSHLLQCSMYSIHPLLWPRQGVPAADARKMSTTSSLLESPLTSLWRHATLLPTGHFQDPGRSTPWELQSLSIEWLCSSSHFAALCFEPEQLHLLSRRRAA